MQGLNVTKFYIFLNLYSVMKKFRTTNLPGNGRQLLFSQIIGSNFFHFIVLFYVFKYIFYAFLLLGISLPCELQTSEGRLHGLWFKIATRTTAVYLARASQLLNITHTNKTCVQFSVENLARKDLQPPVPQSDLMF